MRVSQLATILWLQDRLALYAFSAPKDEASALMLVAGDVAEDSGFTLTISHPEKVTVTANVALVCGAEA